MIEQQFIIIGNQDDKKGNPMPYTRVTQGSKWSDKAIRYAKWKDFVAKEYVYQVVKKQSWLGNPIVLKGKTGEKGKKARMDIEIEWKDYTYADCDNVFKGISDALFDNDKKVWAGSFTSKMAEDGIGKVLIKIIIEEDDSKQKATKERKKNRNI